jgi:hypothetical protein
VERIFLAHRGCRCAETCGARVEARRVGKGLNAKIAKGREGVGAAMDASSLSFVSSGAVHRAAGARVEVSVNKCVWAAERERALETGAQMCAAAAPSGAGFWGAWYHGLRSSALRTRSTHGYMPVLLRSTLDGGGMGAAQA